MGTFILVLLLLAAIFGVLGAVLKVALVLVLGVILALTVVAWGVWFSVRRRLRAWQREVDRRMDEASRRRRAIDIRHARNEADDDRRSTPLELEGDDRS